MSYAVKHDRQAILADYVAGMPVKVISHKHGCDPSYPSLLAALAGLPRRIGVYCPNCGHHSGQQARKARTR